MKGSSHDETCTNSDDRAQWRCDRRRQQAAAVSDRAPGHKSSPNLRHAAAVSCLIGCTAVLPGAVSHYPLELTLDARAKTETAAVASIVTIRVERLMEENRYQRATRALRHGGYAALLNTLRALPPVGTIALASRSVEVRYAREQQDGADRRLVLVADRPLFFLADPAKSRAGYELTLVELRFDAHGDVTGRIAGAARVKPGADGSVVLDDYTEAPVQLVARSSHP